MRYMTVVFRPARELYPTIHRLVERDGVDPVAVHQTRLLESGSAVTLFEARGDEAQLDDALTDTDAVLEYTITGEDEYMVYSHSVPHEVAIDIFELRGATETIVQMPLRFTPDGGLRGTLIGADANFQEFVAGLPEELRAELECTGEYQPNLDHLLADLTERQREILRTAIELGYYEKPRSASQTDIAERLGIAASSVSDHLRRIEAKVFRKELLAATG